LAQYYTSQMKYDPDHFAVDSAALHGLLKDKGFLVDAATSQEPTPP
jgi:hypothetical protein